ncbi:MAG TPA: hypothetical protein VF701_15555 [Thermoanaerobaculia bacterium]
MQIDRLPAGDMIQKGIGDLRAGRVSVASLLVCIGAQRIRRGGLEIPDVRIDEPEIRLYEMLAAEDPDAAHSRYNALIRQLVSFERALECAA